MKKPSEKRTKVYVRANDGMTEVAIIDNHFNDLAKGMGEVVKALKPGIYKVRSKTASSSNDQLIEVTGLEEDGILNIQVQSQDIKSSAPLTNSRYGGASNPELLADMSAEKPNLNPNKDSQLLIFLRDQGADASGKEFPTDSFSIHHANGEKIVDFTDGEINQSARFAGIMIGLDSGVYRLRVETGVFGYETFVFTAKGWQTRVFLTCDDFHFGKTILRRPLLRTASVLMAKIGRRFNPNSHDARLAEVALDALLEGRDIFAADDMQGLLYGKFQDPMLGIYGAHLMLHRNRVDWDLYDTVCKNLYRLVGPVPDVQALYVKSRKKFKPNDPRVSQYQGLPPMLIHSWDLLVQESRKRYSTIPPGSLSDQIATAVVSTQPWLMHRIKSASEVSEQTKYVSYARGKRVMKAIIEKMRNADSSQVRRYLKEQINNLDPIEKAILNAMIRSEHPDLSGSRKRVMSTESIDALQAAKAAMSNLKAPSYSVARSTVTLAKKLNLDDLVE
ncbi:hypothetical protein [Marinicella sp. W31]|uniref:hypothetical protein n=1 Tax=Marinicella sp. W31 TaxID=3023713 RepID=UPI003757902E